MKKHIIEKVKIEPVKIKPKPKKFNQLSKNELILFVLKVVIIMIIFHLFFTWIFQDEIKQKEEELNLKNLGMCEEFGYINYTLIHGSKYCFNDSNNYLKLSHEQIYLWSLINETE